MKRISNVLVTPSGSHKITPLTTAAAVLPLSLSEEQQQYLILFFGGTANVCSWISMRLQGNRVFQLLLVAFTMYWKTHDGTTFVCAATSFRISSPAAHRNSLDVTSQTLIIFCLRKLHFVQVCQLLLTPLNLARLLQREPEALVQRVPLAVSCCAKQPHARNPFACTVVSRGTQKGGRDALSLLLGVDCEVLDAQPALLPLVFAEHHPCDFLVVTDSCYVPGVDCCPLSSALSPGVLQHLIAYTLDLAPSTHVDGSSLSQVARCDGCDLHFVIKNCFFFTICPVKKKI